MKKQLKDLKRGETFYGAGIQWTVLDHSRSSQGLPLRTFVVSTDITESRAFDEGNRCDFAASTLRAYLNGEFLRKLEDELGAGNICEYVIDLTADDGPELYVVERPTRLKTKEGGYRRPTPYPKGFAPTLHAYTLTYPEQRKAPSNIFVCSMSDLFGAWVPDEWIERIFDACKRAPQHTYLFLTKNPARYLDLASKGKLPEERNFWYGTTTTGPDKPFWWSKHHNTFASIEPLLEPFEAAGERGNGSEGYEKKVEWVIIGAMTGPGSAKKQPKREWIQAIVDDASITGVPVFMKDSLKAVWGDDLIREYPSGMDGGLNG